MDLDGSFGGLAGGLTKQKNVFFLPSYDQHGVFSPKQACNQYILDVYHVFDPPKLDWNQYAGIQPATTAISKKMSRDGRSEMVGKPMETQIQPSMAQTISPWVPSQHSPGRDQKYQPWNMSTQQIYKLSVHYVMLFVAGLNRHKSIQLKKQL